MSDEPIDLQSFKAIREIEADQLQWTFVRDQLLNIMAAAPLNNSGLTTATLHALLNMLTLTMEPDDAKQFISERLRMYK